MKFSPRKKIPKLIILITIFSTTIQNPDCKVDQCAVCDDEFSVTCISCEQGFYLKTIYGSERGTYYNDCWSISKLVAAVFGVILFSLIVIGVIYLSYIHGRKKKIEELRRNRVKNEEDFKENNKEIKVKGSITKYNNEEIREELGIKGKDKLKEVIEKLEIDKENLNMSNNEGNNVHKESDINVNDLKKETELNTNRLNRGEDKYINNNDNNKKGLNESIEKEDNPEFKRNRSNKYPYQEDNPNKMSKSFFHRPKFSTEHNFQKNQELSKSTFLEYSHNPLSTSKIKLHTSTLNQRKVDDSSSSFDEKYYTSPDKAVKFEENKEKGNFLSYSSQEPKFLKQKISLNFKNHEGDQFVYENFEYKDYSTFRVWKEKGGKEKSKRKEESDFEIIKPEIEDKALKIKKNVRSRDEKKDQENVRKINPVCVKRIIKKLPIKREIRSKQFKEKI